MPGIISIPLCSVSFCPQPNNPAWHHCIRCGRAEIEHHHVIPRGMGGSPKRKKDKRNVVALCHKHHEEVTTGPYEDAFLDFPTGRVYGVWPSATSQENRAVAGVHDQRVEEGQDAGLSRERWQEMGASLNDTHKNLPWRAGDWALLGEEAFGEEAWQFISDFGKNIINYMWVARVYSPSTRVVGLSWTHHRYCAKLNEDERSFWLRRCLEENLSTTELWKLLHTNVPAVTWRCPQCGRAGMRDDFKEKDGRERPLDKP